MKEMDWMDCRIKVLEDKVQDCRETVQVLLDDRNQRMKEEREFEETLWRIRNCTGDEPAYFWLGDEG